MHVTNNETEKKRKIKISSKKRNPEGEDEGRGYSFQSKKGKLYPKNREGSGDAQFETISRYEKRKGVYGGGGGGGGLERWGKEEVDIV